MASQHHFDEYKIPTMRCGGNSLAIVHKLHRGSKYSDVAGMRTFGGVTDGKDERECARFVIDQCDRDMRVLRNSHYYITIGTIWRPWLTPNLHFSNRSTFPFI